MKFSLHHSATFVSYQHSSVNGLHQLTAFVSQRPWSVISLRQSMTIASGFASSSSISGLHKLLAFVSGLSKSFAFASQYSPSISVSHKIFNLRQSDPLSVNDFHQSTAFVCQQPSSVIGFHYLLVAFT